MTRATLRLVKAGAAAGLSRRARAALVAAAATLAAGSAFAQEAAPNNQPVDGGLGLLPAGSKLAEEVHFFHNIILMPIITGISLFVLALLLWIVVRYNAKANPNAHKFSHNTMLEVAWTGVPILILLFIALFSFELLYKEDIIPDGKMVVAAGDGATTVVAIDNDFPKSRMVTREKHVQVFRATAGARTRLEKDAYTLEGLGEAQVMVTLKEPIARGEQVIVNAGRSLIGPGGFFGSGADQEIALAPSVTLKAIGNQWNWTYAYPDFGDFDFTANMLPANKTTAALYRFETDLRVVVPVGETIRVTTTASDVIHAWALPNFAIKVDAVPGRINETWFKADREGVYYGQCSEICGVKHASMPIAVEVVSREAFCAWVGARQTEYGLARSAEEKGREPVCGGLAVQNLAAAAASASSIN